MQKLHQKQLQELKEKQKVKQQQYIKLLIHMISTQQQLKQVVLFTKDTFQSILSTKPNQSSPPAFFLSDFTPSSISKLVFEEHLNKIKQDFDKLPDSQAKLEHFILIMMKVLFVDPCRLIKKEKEDEIMKNIVKEQNQKSGANRALSPGKRLSSPKKIKQPPNLTKQQNTLQRQKIPSFLQQKPQLASSQFDKYPFYIIALLYMFKQILTPSQTTITFTQLQKFIMGELITSSKPNSNTQFTIQFQQSKKQDFLLHDNGIRRLVYCAGMNVYLCLDLKQQMVKIYTSELKNKQNFVPNRQKHNRKSPQIIDMFYSDFGNTLGLVLGNKSIEIVNFQAFMTKLYQKQFLPLAMHQIVIKFQNPLKRIFFLQMFNKWLIIGSKNQLTLIDVSKYRSKDQEIIMTPIKNQKPQLPITQVLEILQLSVVCVIAGNQVWFFDQKLNKRKYNNYVHQLNISIVKYYEEKNAFYICGDKEKSLTILRPQRGRENMEIHTLTFSRPIIDFEMFSIFGAILLIDDKHTLRLVSEQTKQIYQIQDYGRIVKDDMKENSESEENSKKITILKLNRQNFIIYESYMVSMSLAKVPIQTEMQFEFLPYNYFDPIKEDIYISFNNQILCISLLEGQFRESFTLDNSNLEAPAYFLQASQKWAPFVLDQEGKVYDVCVKEMEGGSENDIKKYKRKLDLKDVQWAVFDEELSRFIIISPHQLYQVRNQRQNTFSTVNVTKFTNFEVLSSTYITSKKSQFLNCLSSSHPILPQSRNYSQANLLNTSSSKLFSINKKQCSPQQQPSPQQQFCLLININQPTLYRVIKFGFEKIKESDKPEVILKCLYVEDYDIAVILTDENVVYLVDVAEENGRGKRQNGVGNRKQSYESERQICLKERKFICIKVYHFIAPKVRDLLKFNQLYVNSLKVTTEAQTNNNNQGEQPKRQSSSQYNSLFLTSQQGFFIEINLQNILQKHFTKPSSIKQVQKNSTSTLKDLCQIDYMKFLQHQAEEIVISKRQAFTFTNIQEQFSLVKAHNSCKIEVIKKIQLQFLLTLTVGRDGFLKLWNQVKQCIVSLKLPTLRKEIFDIRKIQDVRGRRMMQQAYSIVKNITQHIEQRHNVQQILYMNRQNELDKTYEQVNENQPIKIDIENKFIEEIVVDEPSYHNIVDPLMVKRFRHWYGESDESEKAKKIIGMSLKKQRSFENILDKSRINQVNQSKTITIPVELLALRKSLKKYQRKQQSKSIDLPGFSDQKIKKQQLLILPKLKQYKMQSRQGKHPTISTQRRSSTFRQHIDSQDSQYDNFEACAFVKNKIQRKKANELDRIDKEFIRKEYSLLAKKHLAKKKDAVKIVNNKVPAEEKEEMDDSGDVGMSLETIVNDIKRIRYESRFGGDRFIPKVKFKSFSQLN